MRLQALFLTACVARSATPTTLPHPLHRRSSHNQQQLLANANPTLWGMASHKWMTTTRREGLIVLSAIRPLSPRACHRERNEDELMVIALEGQSKFAPDTHPKRAGGWDRLGHRCRWSRWSYHYPTSAIAKKLSGLLLPGILLRHKSLCEY